MSNEATNALSLKTPLSGRAVDAIVAHHDPLRARWRPRDGFLLATIEHAWERSGREDWRLLIRETVNGLVDESGRIASYRREDYDLGMIAPGVVLFRLLADTGDDRYAHALSTLRGQLRSQPRTRSGGFWHSRSCPDQMWVSDAYRVAPFYARCASFFGDPDAYHDVAHQILLFEDRARDPLTGLLSHAWDESRRQLWANPETGRSQCCWGRALGWWMMAVVDSLDHLPHSHPDRARILSALERLARAIMRYQDHGSGLWFQVIDQGKREGNFLESSSTCMFAYALGKAARLGYLHGAEFRETARRAFEGVRRRFLEIGADGTAILHGVSASVPLGGHPYRDGSFSCYTREGPVSDELYGLGALALASMEMELAP